MNIEESLVNIKKNEQKVKHHQNIDPKAGFDYINST